MKFHTIGDSSPPRYLKQEGPQLTEAFVIIVINGWGPSHAHQALGLAHPPINLSDPDLVDTC